MELRPRLTPREGRRFAFTVGIAFAVVGGIMAWRGIAVVPYVCWGLAGVLLVAGVVAPGRLRWAYRVWMALGEAISRVVSPVVMGLIYFLVMTPTGLLMRGAGRNPVRHRERDGGFWMPAASGTADDLENQF